MTTEQHLTWKTVHVEQSIGTVRTWQECMKCQAVRLLEEPGSIGIVGAHTWVSRMEAKGPHARCVLTPLCTSCCTNYDLAGWRNLPIIGMGTFGTTTNGVELATGCNQTRRCACGATIIHTVHFKKPVTPSEVDTALTLALCEPMPNTHDLDEQIDAVHKEALVAILSNIPDPVRPIAQKCLTDIVGRAYDKGFRAGIQHAIERIEAR